jgi:6-pyruvoyltetrahydropterin/6-carboxytetrahydropterin synthase
MSGDNRISEAPGAGIYTIAKQFEFSAAHHLDGLGEGHPCARNHGHNYVVEVTLAATQLDERGFIKDYSELTPLKEYLNRNLDHQDLNQVLPIQPSAENLARYLFELWRAEFPQLVLVRVSETPKTWASYGLALASWLQLTQS